MELLSIIILVLVIIVTVIYIWFKRIFSYWESRDVPHNKPIFPYGNIKGLGDTMHQSMLAKNIYDQFKGQDKICGIYFFHQPIALLLDPELIKNVLIKDFNNFPERGNYYNEKDDPLSAHLFNLNGKEWKGLRPKLSPTFTSGKMKFMFSTVVEVVERFEEHLTEVLKQTDELEIKDLLARFTTDIIGTCAFGIECNSLKDPNAEFRTMGRIVFEEPKYKPIIAFLIRAFEPFSKKLHVKINRDDVSAFFMKVVNDTVEFREKNNVHRNDFMDLLIKMKNEENSINIKEIAAQAFIFFLAGFETSSTTMGYCLYELVLNPDIQEKARQEIRRVLSKHNGKLDYETMKDMHYVDQIIKETLRKYPPVTNLTRRTKNDYPVPGTKHVIEKDTMVWIPAYALQHDPDYYPDPEVFNPDRFSPEEVANRDSTLWLPFGEGPRNCIGLRFGMMQVRVGLVMLLNNFEFTKSPKTEIPIKFMKTTFILLPEGGLWIKMKKLNVPK